MNQNIRDALVVVAKVRILYQQPHRRGDMPIRGSKAYYQALTAKERSLITAVNNNRQLKPFIRWDGWYYIPGSAWTRWAHVDASGRVKLVFSMEGC